MKLSLVLIVYRSDSSIAKEASKFCEEVLKTLLEKNQLLGLVNIVLVIIYSHLK